MKCLILILIVFLSGISASGQFPLKNNVYRDAVRLAELSKEIHSNPSITSYQREMEKIVKKYWPDEDFQNLTGNPFLSETDLKPWLVAVLPPIEPSLRPDASHALSLSNINGFENSIGSVSWQGAALTGISDFMASRFKQEVFQMATAKLFQDLADQKIQNLFPKTYEFSEKVKQNSAYYTIDLLALKGLVQSDIEQLPIQFISNIDLFYTTNNDNIKAALWLGKYIYQYSKQELPVDRMLTSLANENFNNSTISKIVNLADLISQAMLDETDDRNPWINPVSKLPVDRISIEKPAIKYFYGLLFQELVQDSKIKEYLRYPANDKYAVAQKIQNLIRFANKLNNIYFFAESKDFNFKKTEDVVNYLRNIYEAFNYCILSMKDVEGTTAFEGVTEAMDKYLTIWENLLYRNYKKALSEIVIASNLDSKYLKIILFLSQLATTENAEDFESLLNSYALPIGSSSIKRKSSFNLSVNGYVGLTAGCETAYGQEKNQRKTNFGLSAPIGVSTTFLQGNTTFFVSFFDLGSMVNHRFNNMADSYSNLKFEHFFTPGVGIFYNLPKIPVTTGFHFNYIPNLRTINFGSVSVPVTEQNRSVTRFNISFLVDIPFFTLSNKTNDKVLK